MDASLSNDGTPVRLANARDIDDIVRVTNAAYVVEQFCLQGDRTDAAGYDLYSVFMSSTKR